MANYVANYKKKSRILQKREQELLHAINHEFSTEKIRKAAEHVRVAKLNMYKSSLGRFHLSKGSGKDAKRSGRRKLQSGKLSPWTTLSKDMRILAE